MVEQKFLHFFCFFFQEHVRRDQRQSRGLQARARCGPTSPFRRMHARRPTRPGTASMGPLVLLSKLQTLSYTIASKYFLYRWGLNYGLVQWSNGPLLKP